MSDQEKNKPGFRPEDFKAGKEGEEGKEESVERASLSNIIGDEPFVFTEGVLEGDEKEQGVSVTTSRNGEQQFIFDRQHVDEKEKQKLREFQSLIRDKGGKEALKGTPFEWFFDEESEDFLQDLAEFIERRIEEIDEGGSTSALQNYGFSEKLVSAMQSFREMAKRDELKRAIDQQVKRLPIRSFKARLREGQHDSRAVDGVVELRFNPENMNDPTNEVDIMLVKGTTGENELIFSLKDHEKYQSMTAVLMKPEHQEEARADGKFWFSDSDPLRPVEEQDNADGTNFTRFEFGVDRGGSNVMPLFSRVKIFRRANDLDGAIDKYAEQKRREEEEQRRLEEEKRRRAQLTQYTSTPPSSSSSSSSSSYRWNQQPQTYVRSG